MAVDGITTLGGDNSLKVTDLTEPGWGPGQFQAYQLQDYLDFRAIYPGENRSILRLWSNLEAHLYGELILHDGAIRSFNTLSIACVTDDTDIASFRSGTNTGEQVALIDKEGAYSVFSGSDQGTLSYNQLKFTAGGTILGQSIPGAHPQNLTIDGLSIAFQMDGALWGTFSYSAGQSRLDTTSGEDYQDLIITANQLRFYTADTVAVDFYVEAGGGTFTNVAQIAGTGEYRILQGGTPAAKLSSASLEFNSNFTIKGLSGSTPKYAKLDVDFLDLYASTSSTTTDRWGKFSTPGGSTRVLTISNAAGSLYKPLVIEANDLLLKLDDNGSLDSWGAFSTTGTSVRKLTINNGGGSGKFGFEAFDFELRLDTNGSLSRWGLFSTNTSLLRKLTISDGSTPKDLQIDAADINLATLSSGKVKIRDSSGTIRYEFSQSAGLNLTAPTATSATLTLDSATGGGKTWQVVSNHSNDDLRLRNDSDSLNAVRITHDGNVIAARYLVPVSIATTGGTSLPGDGVKGAIFFDDDGTTLWVFDGTDWKGITLPP